MRLMTAIRHGEGAVLLYTNSTEDDVQALARTASPGPERADLYAQVANSTGLRLEGYQNTTVYIAPTGEGCLIVLVNPN